MGTDKLRFIDYRDMLDKATAEGDPLLMIAPRSSSGMSKCGWRGCNFERVFTGVETVYFHCSGCDQWAVEPRPDKPSFSEIVASALRKNNLPVRSANA